MKYRTENIELKSDFRGERKIWQKTPPIDPKGKIKVKRTRAMYLTKMMSANAGFQPAKQRP